MYAHDSSLRVTGRAILLDVEPTGRAPAASAQTVSCTLQCQCHGAERLAQVGAGPLRHKPVCILLSERVFPREFSHVHGRVTDPPDFDKCLTYIVSLSLSLWMQGSSRFKDPAFLCRNQILYLQVLRRNAELPWTDGSESGWLKIFYSFNYDLFNDVFNSRLPSRLK
jgi:hypothetical protein